MAKYKPPESYPKSEHLFFVHKLKLNGIFFCVLATGGNWRDNFPFRPTFENIDGVSKNISRKAWHPPKL